jgi:hypothetical protein
MSTKKKSIPKALRMKLWEQQFGDTLSGNCFTCHRNVKVDDFQAGHIIAEANGGQVTLSNLKVVCKPCNTSCGTMDLNSFKQVLETTDEKKVKKPNETNTKREKEDVKLMPPPPPRPVGTNLVYQQPTSPPRPQPGNNLTLNQRVALAVGGDTREMFLKW